MPGRRWLVGLVLSLSLGMVFTPSPASAVGCDVNADGVVNLLDLVAVATHYGAQATVGDAYDINADGWVNLFDLVLVARCYGGTAPTPAVPTRWATPTSLPYPTATRFPGPTSVPYPTPQVPIPDPYGGGEYTLVRELHIGAYAVREWTNSSGAPCPPFNVVTMSSTGQVQAEIRWVDHLDSLTGRDITGDGHPDVVAHCWTGGNHGYYYAVVYDLGATAAKIAELPWSVCRGSFNDWDGDQTYEYTTCDEVFFYSHCRFNPLGGSRVTVVMDYVPGQGYVPASPHFPSVYDGTIIEHTRRAESELGGWHNCEESGDLMCSVLGLTLDYLYSGRPQQAWSEFYRLYQCPGAESLRTEIELAVYQSPLFVPQ